MTSRPVLPDPEAVPRRLFTRDDYQRAGELGLFGPEERLELIGGEVVRKMSPQKTGHATAIRRAEEALRQAFPHGHDVRVQLPLALGAESEPEPDLCVVRGSLDDYEQSHPTTAVLVMEVADTSLSFDRRVKGSLYARAGIPDYRLLNLPGRALEVHRDPEPDPDAPFGYRYRTVLRFTGDARVAPLGAPGHEIAVAALLPRA